MARDEPVRDADGPAEPTVSDDEQSEHSILDRRSYLKLASATAVAAGVGTSAASAAEGDYEVIEARGQSIRIDSGETWENKLIDFGDRNNITITAKGSNWTIRNIGFTGTIPYNETIFGVCDSGSGTSVMENIYFGESTGEQPSSERSICIWVDPSHSGHLDVTNVNFNVPGNNGIYGSAPAYNGDGGTIALEGCYGNDCHHTAFRIGDCGMSIENCVSYKSGTRAANRNTWVWEGNYGGGATVRNSHFITNGTGGSVVTNGSPNLTLENVHTDDGRGDGSNPQHFVPDGCPESGAEAASGGSAGSSRGTSSPPADDEDSEDEDLPENTLTVTGTGDATEYYVETTDELVADPNADSLEVHDEITGTSASGWVTTSSHVDSFRFAGDLHEVAFRQGSARVEVNGEVIDPDQYNGDQPSLENTLLVDGIGTAGGTSYEFTVSEAVEKATVEGATIDDEDAIDGGHVAGGVAGWRDGFRFGGDLEELTVDGDARVLVNGEAVDPADYGQEQPHVLTLVGNGSAANYEISVDGTIDTVAGDDSEAFATVSSGTTVEGSIERSAQRFRFSGTLTDVTFIDGSAHVYLDDRRIDPDQYGEQELLPNAIVIDGAGTDGETSYSFDIDGDVVTASYRDASVDPSDEIEGRSVTGSVDDELDAYWFDGDITDFRLRGNANVDVQYNARSN